MWLSCINSCVIQSILIRKKVEEIKKEKKNSIYLKKINRKIYILVKNKKTKNFIKINNKIKIYFNLNLSNITNNFGQ